MSVKMKATIQVHAGLLRHYTHLDTVDRPIVLDDHFSMSSSDARDIARALVTAADAADAVVRPSDASSAA